MILIQWSEGKGSNYNLISPCLSTDNRISPLREPGRKIRVANRPRGRLTITSHLLGSQRIPNESPKELSPVRCCRGKPGGSEPAELSRWISLGTLGHARTYAKHRRALPQIHRKADGAEVTIEKRDTEFTEHAHDGSDDGRRTERRGQRKSGRRYGARWEQPGCRRRCRARRRRRWRVPGRRSDQETTDGQQASGELRLRL